MPHQSTRARNAKSLVEDQLALPGDLEAIERLAVRNGNFVFAPQKEIGAGERPRLQRRDVTVYGAVALPVQTAVQVWIVAVHFQRLSLMTRPPQR